VVGHGIDPALRTRVLAEAARFFALPVAEKTKVSMKQSPCNRGYEAMGWVDAPPVPDSFVVNLGDMIARLTKGRYGSTLHRVVNLSGRERYFVPFFYSGNPDEPVVCPPGCGSTDEPPRYAPTTVEGHLREMYARTHA
jgi:isopenicillin N synthase-like dioxygenase